MTWLDTAAKALHLHRKGKTRVEIRDLLKFRYADEAQRAIDAGRYDEQIRGPALAPDEIAILFYLARCERRQLEFGGRKGIHCDNRQLYRIRKRLDTHRKGEPEFDREGRYQQGTGLGLICCYHGGRAFLHPAGWAVVHALEGLRAATTPSEIRRAGGES